jgi:hypothetical protein
VPTHWRLQIWCVFVMVSYTMWGPRSITKLVNISPMSLWFIIRK